MLPALVFTGLIIILCIFMVVRNFSEKQKEITAYLGEISQQNIDEVENYFSGVYDCLSTLSEDFTQKPEYYNEDREKIIMRFASVCRQRNFYAITLAAEDEIYEKSFINSNGQIINLSLDDKNFNKETLDKTGRFVSGSLSIDGLEENVNFVFQKSINPDSGKEYVAVVAVPSRIIEKKLDKGFLDGSGYSMIWQKDSGPIISSGDTDAVELNKAAQEGLVKLESNDGNVYYTYCSLFDDESQWIAAAVVPEKAVKKRISLLTASTVKICLGISVFVIILLGIFLIYREKDSKEIIKAAYTDDLTGYKNKQKFKIELEEILKNNRLAKYAIVLLDIDNFKTFNEFFGFDEGDRVLKYASDIINKAVNEGEIFCRSNSDNFYMLIKFDSKKQIEERLMNVMNKISAYKPSENRNYKIVSYCGVYRINPKYFESGANFLIDRARLALMRIVRNHENGYSFYNEIFKNNIIFETELENDMEQALADGDFKIYVQPKYEINTGSIAGGEALIRWQHKTKGFLTPNKFIELFERNHFIIKLDYYVLETICKMQKKWLDMGFETVPVSVNQSKLNIFQDNYIESILKIVSDSGVLPELVELEITEDMAYQSFSEVVNVITELHKHGIKFSMDDFGSGYSSLNMLKNLDIDVIKLDKAFFDESSGNEKGKIIVSSSLEMAHKLNIKSVAEGVETKEHVDFLKTTSCNIAQGFYYSKPIPIEEFEKLIRNQSVFRSRGAV